MTNNPVSLIVMILLAAFVIDRIAAALLFLLSFSGSWSKRFPEPAAIESDDARRLAEKKHKLLYFVVAAALAFVFLLSFKEVGVMKALGFQSETTATTLAPTIPAEGAASPTPTPLEGAAKPSRSLGDFLLTWLLLVGGAENIARLLRSRGEFGQEAKEPQPIEITGKLTLEDRSGRNA